MMWIVWAGLAVALLLLLLYRSNLTRYEEDQLFLGEAFTQEQRNQQDILRRVNRLNPVMRALGVGAGVMTAAIVGMYAWDALRHF
jgi:hypothetical protein